MAALIVLGVVACGVLHLRTRAAAIADENRRALADPDLMAEDRRQGEMYRERIEGIGYRHDAWMDAARSSMIRREANALRRRAFRAMPDTAATEAGIAHFGGWR